MAVQAVKKASQASLHSHCSSKLFMSKACSLQGFEAAKKATLAFLETFKDEVSETDHETLRCAARTSLRTKLYEELADQLTDIVVDAVLTIRNPTEALDLYMVGAGLGSVWVYEEWGQGCLAASLVGCLKAPGVLQSLQEGAAAGPGPAHRG